MKKILLLISILLFCGSIALAQESGIKGADQSSDLEVAECLRYRKLGFATMSFYTEKKDYKSGERVGFSGILENTSDFPIINGNILVQIFRQGVNENIKYLVDEYFLDESFNLNPKSKKEVNFTWTPPQTISGGIYSMNASFLIDKKMFVTGIPINENSPGFQLFFGLEKPSSVNEVLLDKDQVLFNDKRIKFDGSLPDFIIGKDIEVKMFAKNLGDGKKKTEITKRLYSWDNYNPDKVIQGSQETAEVEKDYLINDVLRAVPEGVYMYEVTATSNGIKSILRIRFTVLGNKPIARPGFLALSSFPLIKDKPVYTVGCFHAASYNTPFDGKVYMTIRDNDNNILQRSEYRGLITPDMMAIRQNFVPDKDYNQIWLDAMLYNKDGTLLDQVSLKYDCQQFSKQAARVQATVLKGGKIEALPLNLCGGSTKANVVVEVLDGQNRIFFYDPGQETAHYSKRVGFKYGQTYKINISADGAMASLQYTHKERDFTWIFILLSILGFGGVYWYFTRKQ